VRAVPSKDELDRSDLPAFVVFDAGVFGGACRAPASEKNREHETKKRSL
jgi:hypothetical protein